MSIFVYILYYVILYTYYSRGGPMASQVTENTLRKKHGKMGRGYPEFEPSVICHHSAVLLPG